MDLKSSSSTPLTLEPLLRVASAQKPSNGIASPAPLPVVAKQGKISLEFKQQAQRTSQINAFIASLDPQYLIGHNKHSIAFMITDDQPLVSFERISKPSIESAVETSQELSSKIRMKLLNASERKDVAIKERALKLRRRSHQRSYKMLLHQHREKLEKLKLQAKIEYSLTAASVRRHLILRKNVERWSARVEHVQNIALIQKFKRLTTLRRALSDSIIGLVNNSNDSDADEDIQGYLLRHASVSEMFQIPEELNPENFESESDSVTMAPLSPSTISISTNSTAIKSRAAYDAPLQRDLPLLDIYSNLVYDHEPETPICESVLESKCLPPSVFLDMDEITYLELLPLLPNVTRFSLRELDIDEIITNAQVRHDLYFDPNLQFKANNLEGEKGQEKKEANARYWADLTAELENGFYYRVPLLLFEVQKILKELLPKTDEAELEVSEWMDTKLISQQIEHAVFDAPALVKNLADMLKRHCAPIRDEAVDAMVAECNAGRFGETLKQMFEILELMKLDYANYQMTRIRPFVMEKAVEFEWRWFKDQVDLETIGVESTSQWLATFGGDASLNTQQRFLNATVELILSMPTLPSSEIPETFSLDHNRLNSMHSDWQDIIILSSLLLIFRQFAGSKLSNAQLSTVKTTLWVLLNDNETSMEHIVLELCNQADKIRTQPMNASERATLTSMVEKALGPNDAIYNLLQSRTKLHILALLNGKELDDSLISKHGLSHVTEEIKALSEKISQMTDLNWKVYFQLYNTLLTSTE